MPDHDQMAEAALGHRVRGLLEVPLDVGERGVRGQVLGDVLVVGILALADRPYEVAPVITTAPTLWSAMNFAASRRVRPGVIVRTSPVIASRTFTTAPLRLLPRQMRKPYRVLEAFVTSPRPG